MDMLDIAFKLFTKNGMVASFMMLGLITYIAYRIENLTKDRIHGSAIAIFLGLVLAYFGGIMTGGTKGIADIPVFAGMGLVGGAMFRDFAIVSTAFGADLREIKKIGWRGVVSLLLGEFICLIAGIAIAYPMGYTSAVDLVTIGAGIATFVVGPVTGAALGASSEVIAISIAAGVVKSVLVMLVTPFVAKPLGIDNPQSAMAFGGIMGTTSGTAAGMAAVNPKLVPYAAMTATFYTGLGCLLFPSLFYFMVHVFI
ncbi:MAG: malonate transporter subunit MadM [Dialister sp.]|nr:malonate transporter subunit MadM [Dialister sp.]